MCWGRSNKADDKMRKLILKKRNTHLLRAHSFSIRGYKTPNKIYKLIWTFHLTDADCWPSVPHGHNDEKGLKLDIITGEVFSAAGGKCVGHATLKELNKLNANKRFRQFVRQHVTWYRQTYPNTSIRCPEWADQRLIATRRTSTVKRETFFTCITTQLE